MKRALTIGAVCAAVVGMAVATSTAAERTWRSSYSSSYPLPSNQVGELTSLVAISPQRVLAVGYSEFATDTVSSPVIKIYDGHSWRTWAHQQKATNKSGYQIDSIAATSLSDVWLVVTATEDQRPNEAYTRQIRHWNGHHWHSVTLDGLPQNWIGTILLIGGRPQLVGQGATQPLDATAAFVASYGKVRGRPHWTAQTVSRTGGLGGGYVRSGKDAWAVGGTFDGTYQGPDGIGLALQWNGQHWRRTPVPRPVATLTAVAAVSKRSALAVGDSSTSDGVRHPVAYRWNGHAWHSIAIPGHVKELAAVAPDGNGGYWAAGQSSNDRTHTAYYHLTSGHWSTVRGPSHALPGSPPGQRAAITDLVTKAGTVWSSGYVAAHGCADSDGCPNDSAGQLIVDRR